MTLGKLLDNNALLYSINDPTNILFSEPGRMSGELMS